MKISKKLTLAFVLVAMMVGIAGLFSVSAIERVINFYQGDEKHFEDIISASTEALSYAKRAEGHLIMFLALRDPADREKFFQRHESLDQQIRILDEIVLNPNARELLNEIRPKAAELLLVGNELLKAYDDDIVKNGKFDLATYLDQIQRLNSAGSTIRSKGVELSLLESDLAEQVKIAGTIKAKVIQHNILITTAAAFLIAIVFGYFFSRSIAKPLTRLRAATVEIGNGNFDNKIEINSKDETGDLARAFNLMIDNLSSSNLEIVSARNFTENILGSMADVLIVVDLEGIITRVNRATRVLTGYCEGELVNQPFSIISDDNDVFTEAKFLEIKEKGFINGIEKNLRTKDGKSIPISLSVSVMRDPEGNAFAFVCIAQDISQRKRAEAEREVISEIIQGITSTANLDELLQRIHQSLGKVLYAENCYVALVDPKTELLTMQFFVDKHDPTPPTFKMGGLTGYVFKTGQPMLLPEETIRELSEKGDIAVIGTNPAIWLGVPLRTPDGIIGVLVLQHYDDATAYDPQDVGFLDSVGDQIALAIQRKRVEETLQISEEQHRLLFESNPQPVLVYDLETLAFLAVNEAAIRHYGYSSEEFLSEIMAKDIRPPADIPEFINRVSHVTAVTDLFLVPGRHKKKDGTIMDVEITSHVIVFAGRRAEIVIVNDVTERRRLQVESEIISEVIQGVTTTANLEELLQLIHRSIGRILYAENFYVALYDAKTDLLSVPFCIDKYDEPAAPAKLGTGLTAYVLRKGQPMLMTSEVIRELTERGDVASIGTNPAVWLGVPLRTPEGIIGVLVVQHYEDATAYDQRDLGFLSSVGDQIALAIERKRAENALRENEEKYRELFENANDIIYTLDLSGGFTSLNRAGEEITGYSRSEALQMSIADVVAPNDIASVRDRIAQNIKGADLSNFELEIIAKDERKVTMDISSRLILQDGVPMGIQGIGRDITERKQTEEKLRESEEWMRTIFDGSRDGIIIEDKGAIVYANKSFAKLFGYDEPEEVIGKLDTNFLPFEELERMMEFGRRRLLGEDAPSVYEFKGKRKDEMLVEMEAAVSTSVVGGKKYIMTAIRDITERLEARHELERFNEKLQQSNRELQDFAYVASHDLQEPLRKVQAFSDRLKTKYEDKLEGDGLDYLERMRSAASRMQLLIQDLLAFSRVSTKVQPFIPVNLKTVTEEVLSDLEIKVEESGATIELKDLPTIDADPMQMRQLIQNLVGNALKFRQKDTALNISISGSPANLNGAGLPGHIQISVQDNGIGFDEKYTDKIFAVFQRLHGRTEYEGSGVGLAICRKIVERHNGNITAQSQPGNGSTFVVTMPIKQSAGELN